MSWKPFLLKQKKHYPLSSVPVQKLPTPAVPAAVAVSEGDGPGDQQSREPLQLTDPIQRLQGWGSSSEERGHRIPTAEMILNLLLLLLIS